MRTLALLVILFFIALPSAHAEENETQLDTGSGSTASGELTISPEEQERMDKREARRHGFLLRFTNAKDKAKKHREQQSDKRAKRIAHLRGCREEVRRANKVTKYSVIERCFKAQHTQHLIHLRKEQAHVSELPGVSDETKAMFSQNVDALADAIGAIIDAVETGVYRTETDLLEGKTALRDIYWKPYWLSRTKVRAETLLSWIAHATERLASKASETAEASEACDDCEETSESEPEPKPTPTALLDASQCLLDAEELLESILKSDDHLNAKMLIADAVASIRHCLQTLKSATIEPEPEPQPEHEAASDEAFEASEASEASEAPRLPRRLQRHYHNRDHLVPQADSAKERTVEFVPEAVERIPERFEEDNDIPRRLQRRFNTTPRTTATKIEEGARERIIEEAREEEEEPILYRSGPTDEELRDLNTRLNDDAEGIPRRLQRALRKPNSRFGQ